MKGKLKVFVCAFVLMLVSFIGINSVNAESVTIQKKDYVTTYSRKESRFYMSNGQYGYCVEPSKRGGQQGASMNYAGTYDDNGVMYLVERTNGADQTDYLSTQLAIWQAKNNFMPKTYLQHQDSEVYKKAIQKVNLIHANSNYHTPDVTISSNGNSHNMTLSSDGSYYQSDAISASIYGANTYTASVSGMNGAYLVDANGNRKNTFANNEKFYVRVPASSVSGTMNGTVKMSVSGKIHVMKKWSDGTHQDLITVVTQNKTADASTRVTVTKTETKHVCEPANGKYYGKDGKETTEEDYKSQCEKQEVHICMPVTDTDNTTKYYGKDGQETTYENYKSECEKEEVHICEPVTDNNGNTKYYDKEGKEVNEAEYKAACETPVPENPKTGVSDYLGGTAVAVSGAGVGLYVLNKKKKMFI